MKKEANVIILKANQASKERSEIKSDKRDLFLEPSIQKIVKKKTVRKKEPVEDELLEDFESELFYDVKRKPYKSMRKEMSSN